ncbi:hypothetical protein HY404_03680 [Candidatus Microgenomates bacterium]|nr:hypothetical protein [Candidatus Microgenomates bacterium]
MSKRRKFLLTSGILSSAFLFIQLSNFLFRYEAILVVIGVSLILSFWALRDSLRFNATVLTLVLPVLFTAGVGLFYFLLPASQLARLPVVLLYGLGMYALLLTSNIYNVASIRTIALLRAAHAVGFLLTLLASFFLFDTLWSFRLYPHFNALIAAFLALPLLLQNLWSIELSDKISRRVWQLAGVAGLIVGEISFMISLWPLTVLVSSLFLTSILYVILGLTQAYLQNRLFAKTVKEYLLVGLVVAIAVYVSARWGG